MTEYGEIHLRFSVNLGRIVGSNNVSNTCEDLINTVRMKAFGSPHLPSVVVSASSTMQVSSIMKLATENIIPFTPQGSRTGLSVGSPSIRRDSSIV